MVTIDRMTERNIAERFRNSTRRLILLDYDGTLVEYRSKPENALPSEKLNDLLRKITSDNYNSLYIISGRGFRDIDALFEDPDFNLIAEHGALIKSHGEWKALLGTDNSWKLYVRPLVSGLQETCPGSFLEEKEYSIAWHYRNAEVEKGNKYSRKLISTISSDIHTRNLRIIDGNKVVEVTAAGVSKGNAVKSLLTENDYDFILCAGDDRTDEDMFFLLRRYDQAVTIKVGGGETLARHRTEDSGTLLSLLGHLAG